MDSTSYSSGDELTLAPPVIGDAGQHLVSLASGTTVEVVTVTDEITVEFDERVTDISVGTYVIVLSGDTVFALTDDGVTHWRTTLDDASYVASHASMGIVGVLSGHNLVGLDVETGAEVFRQDCPHPDLDPHGLFGACWGIVLPAWSYLAAVNPEGKNLFDVNLPGTIETVGTISDRVLVGLRNGEAVSVSRSGDTTWRYPLDAHQFGSTGDETLPVVLDDGVSIIDTEGETTQLPVPADNAKAVYRSTNQAICCVLKGTNVFVHRQLDAAPSELSVAVPTEELDRGDQLPVTLSNKGDSPIVANVSVSVDGGHISGGNRKVTLNPGENRELSVPVFGIEGDEIAVEVSTSEATIFDTTVPVAGSPLEEVLEANAELVGVEDGAVTVDLTVHNESQCQVRDLEVDPPGKSLNRLPPDGSVSVDHSMMFEPGATVTMAVTGVVTDQRVMTRASIDIPASLVNIDILRPTEDTPFVDVRIQNNVSTPVRDTLVVEIGQQTYERPLEIPPRGGFTIAVPLTDLIVTVTISGIGHTTRAEFKSTPTLQVIQADDASASGTGTIDVSRQISNGRAKYATLEQLVLKNTGSEPVEEVQLTVGGATWATERISAGTELELFRWHQLPAAGSVEIGGGHVSHVDGETPVDPQMVEIAEPDIPVDVSVSTVGSNLQLSISVTNETHEAVGLYAVAADLGGPTLHSWEADVGDFVTTDSILPGESASETLTVPTSECDVGDEPVRIGLGIRSIESDSRDNRTVLAVTDDEPDKFVSVAVADGEDIVAGEYGHLTLSVTNEMDQDLSDLRIEAQGTPIQSVYAPQEDETLTPGETLSHYVGVNPDRATEVSLTLTIDGTRNGQRFSQQLTVAGPIADTEETTRLDEWTVTRTDDETEGDQHRFSTGYITEENHRL